MKEYYSHSVEECLADLGSDGAAGLAAGEAARRLEEFGPNEISEAPRTSIFLRFGSQFTNLIVVILVAAALISMLLQEWTDTVVIAAIVLANGILGFVQEEKAERSLAALKKLTSPRARILRGGETKVIESRELVPGDIVEIEAGDFVPADVRIIEQMNLRLDESPLTGESTPVHKTAADVLDANTPLAERRNMAFMGTTVSYGRGRAAVAAAGMQTEVGKIAGLLQAGSRTKTPLQQKLEKVGHLLIWVTLGICVVIFALGLARGEDLMTMFLTAVSLAVAAIPEGLPAVVTIALALGVQRMVRRNVLVRKLSSVETLGCVSVICTDKTGTLTQNAMTVRKIFAAGKIFEISGAGYGLEGGLSCGGERCETTDTLMRAFEIGAVCNNAGLMRDEKTQAMTAVGDPTEAALLVAAAKGGCDWEALKKSFERVNEIPFDSERKMMSVLVSRESGGRMLFTKGAPDIVVERCGFVELDGDVRPFEERHRKAVLDANQMFAGSALRVLAVAYRKIETDESKPEEEGLVFVGLFAMMDPPRPDVRAAVDECRRAGIRPVMVTGDHRDTAIAVARELDIWEDDALALSGAEIDGLSDEELFERVERVCIYARVTAEHKMRIVAAWKRRGNVVAVTGDGVNDAPAIKEADIGISMGITGTDVTKEASDMIITDDNFASIVHGVEEGRSIYANIKKFIHFLLSCNIGEVLTMFFASLVGWPVPLMAAQILWINLVTDGLPALALGVEPPEKRIMHRRPRPPSESIIPAGEFSIMAFQGLAIAIAALAAFRIGGQENGRTMCFATLVVSQLFHVFNCRSAHRSIFKNGLLANKSLLAAFLLSFSLQVLVIMLPVGGLWFHLVPLDAREWLVVFALSLGPIAATEIVKIFVRRGMKTT